MRAVALDADRAHIRAEADVMVSERELRALLWDEKAGLSAIEAKVKEHEGFEATARIIGIKVKRELMGVLTPEQRAKQKALWEQYRHAGRGHMMKAETAECTRDVAVETNAELPEIELSELEVDPSAG
jgi:Spy/CpxP family protein refolding chaperone